LHPQGINVYLRERDGIRLSAARTLSRDPSYRQLSVRRLITMICRALEQQMQWVVFEPNNPALRDEVRLVLQNYLRQLFRAGAFRGATEEQAFFVRCDATNNPPLVADAGQLIAEIGVAPAEPLEFIVLRLAREGDGTLTFTEK
jgi:phage tail sheath protein FI